MLHGFGGGAFSWRLVAAAVAAKTHTRCVMLDRPGFGLTERPDRSDFPEDANPYAITTQVRLS
jgi:pimeloyl-ACP methyl ester carboxylesterase